MAVVATVVAVAVVVAAVVVAVGTVALQDSARRQLVAARIAGAVVVVDRLSLLQHIHSAADEAILVMWQRANRPVRPDHPSFVDRYSSMDQRRSARSSSTVTYLHQLALHRPQIAQSCPAVLRCLHSLADYYSPVKVVAPEAVIVAVVAVVRTVELLSHYWINLLDQ